VTDETWTIVAALCSLAGASLAIRSLTSQTTWAGWAGYLLVLATAGGLGYWLADDMQHSGPLGLAAGLAMTEAAPWLWRAIRKIVERKAAP